jgi:ATP-dependent exoDNAse (exonuclease V) beta subunit
LQENGTVVNGSIDFVYKTSEGAVLIDFKTFPQVEAITNPTSSHFAGYYAGQLNAYATALEAAGENVIKRYIYYPVSGMVVEIGE